MKKKKILFLFIQKKNIKREIQENAKILERTQTKKKKKNLFYNNK